MCRTADYWEQYDEDYNEQQEVLRALAEREADEDARRMNELIRKNLEADGWFKLGDVMQNVLKDILPGYDKVLEGTK